MSILKTIAYKLFYTMLLSCGVVILSAQSPAREYQIKAVFLFNFTQFVEWPATAFSSEETPLVIGILGEDPFNSYLDEVISNEKVNNHPLIVRRFKNTEQIEACHILFVSKSHENKMSRIRAVLKDKNTLTVSDGSNFIKEGGMIRFITLNKKIQFQINPEAVKAANLTISSKLLRLAEIVSIKKE
ncbi:MAG TPA: YfiR family protein [Cytophagales bacterium]|nr:YfiR family protein [Cytophagales bacterium]